MSRQVTRDWIASIVERACQSGATDAEVLAVSTQEFSVEVRMGAVEKVQEAGSFGLGLRVLLDGRQASCSTSDVSEAAITELIANAVEMARSTSIDDAAILPEPEPMDPQQDSLPLSLFDPAIPRMETGEKIQLALRAEDAARSSDPRIANSEGAACTTIERNVLLHTSRGLGGQYSTTQCGLAVAPIARDHDQMQVGYWNDRQCQLAALASPEEIGQEAARRAIRKLGARKIRTCTVPVIFEAEAAAALLRDLFEAVNGAAVFRRASFLVGQLGELVASPLVTIIDDGLLPGAIGSRPFDGEGCPTRRTLVIEQGHLRHYLLNTYTGRKLQLPTTGNAVRSLTGPPMVGVSNFHLAPGAFAPTEIVATLDRGLYVTDLIGFGFNPVTGDYSRGAAGWWIERGEWIHPVEEVTIAGNLREMLRGIEQVGNDLHFRGKIAAPTLRLEQMSVSGT
ncbi:MAG: TldD/PmbA family protein [Blastocatellia bacterium]|jgi:PmbA protein